MLGPQMSMSSSPTCQGSGDQPFRKRCAYRRDSVMSVIVSTLCYMHHDTESMQWLHVTQKASFDVVRRLRSVVRCVLQRESGLECSKQSATATLCFGPCVMTGHCTSLLLAASAKASCAENVLFPTPPFPDSTSILCLILRMRCSIATRSGSGVFGAVAQIS